MTPSTCAWCAEPFTPNREGRDRSRYCSPRCRYEVRRKAGFAAPAHPDPDTDSPMVWGGIKQYNDIPQRQDYRVVCTWCADEEWEYWAKSEIPRRLDRCRRCGGFRTVEPDWHTGKRPGLVEAERVG